MSFISFFSYDAFNLVIIGPNSQQFSSKHTYKHVSQKMQISTRFRFVHTNWETNNVE